MHTDNVNSKSEMNERINQMAKELAGELKDSPIYGKNHEERTATERKIVEQSIAFAKDKRALQQDLSHIPKTEPLEPYLIRLLELEERAADLRMELTARKVKEVRVHPQHKAAEGHSVVFQSVEKDKAKVIAELRELNERRAKGIATFDDLEKIDTLDKQLEWVQAQGAYIEEGSAGHESAVSHLRIKERELNETLSNLQIKRGLAGEQKSRLEVEAKFLEGTAATPLGWKNEPDNILLREPVGSVTEFKNAMNQLNTKERRLEAFVKRNPAQKEGAEKALHLVQMQKAFVKLSRAQDLLSNAKGADQETLLNLSQYLLKEYTETYSAANLSLDTISLSRFSSHHLPPPQMMHLRQKALEAGYNREKNPIEAVLKQSDRPEARLESKITEFMKFARENPQEAQYLMNDIAPLVAALNVGHITYDYRTLMKQVRESTEGKDVPLRVTKEMVQWLPLADLSTSLWEKYQKGDVAAIKLIKALHMDEAFTEFPLPSKPQEKPSSHASGVHAFVDNLSYLQAERALLEKNHAMRAESVSARGLQRIERDIIEKTLADAKFKAKKGEKPRTEFEYGLSWSNIKKWTKDIWVGETFGERVGRTVITAGCTAGATLCIVGGVLVTVMAGPIGLALGPSVMSLAALFPPVYNGANSWLDGKFHYHAPTVDELRAPLLAENYVTAMQSKGGMAKLSPVRASQLPKAKRIAAEKLTNELIQRANGFGAETKPIKNVVVFNRLFEGCEEREPQIFDAALNGVIEKWLQPKITEGILLQKEDYWS